MPTTTSQDGTTIAYDQAGNGPPVILIGGALSTRQREGSLAALLASQFTAVSYDRRGRGDSGDTQPYSVEREIEDVAALIDAVGGSAALYGTSSGANLALLAAEAGLNVAKLALWEVHIYGGEPLLPDGYVERIETLVASGDRGGAVEHFMTAAAGVPAEFVAGMRQMPIWPGMEAVAHTLAYDGRAVAAFEDRELPRLNVPTLVIDGGHLPRFVKGADALARALPHAKRRRLDQPHNVADDVIAPVLAEFFSS